MHTPTNKLKDSAIALSASRKKLLELEEQLGQHKKLVGQTEDFIRQHAPEGGSFFIPDLGEVLHVPPKKTSQPLVFKPVTVLA